MSETTPLRDEVRAATWKVLTDHQWRDWECSCGGVDRDAREYEDNHLSDVLADALLPLLARKTRTTTPEETT